MEEEGLEVAKPWDKTLKLLVHAAPHAFVRWFIPHAQYLREWPSKLSQEDLDVDALLELVINGQRMLLHIEFQTYYDATMADRLLRYNVLARMKYGLPVLSCVIYLLTDGTVPSSPRVWDAPGGQAVLAFHFVNIKLTDLSQEELLSAGIVGLIPLSPFTKDGANRQAVQRMFNAIEAAEGIEVTAKKQLSFISFTLAALIFNRSKSPDLDWLLRRFHDMHEIIKESPIFQEVLREGFEEGLEQGLEKGREEELQKRLTSLRSLLVAFAQSRSPSLQRLAQEQGEFITDPRILEDLTLKVGLAQTAEEAEGYLL
jgi:predicted transposase YdaD